MANLEEEIKLIQERNQRVSADKAWELCWTRRLFIASATYIIAGIWLMMINDFYPWLKALVPAAAYLLSTLTLPAIKKWWVNKYIR